MSLQNKVKLFFVWIQNIFFIIFVENNSNKNTFEWQQNIMSFQSLFKTIDCFSPNTWLRRAKTFYARTDCRLKNSGLRVRVIRTALLICNTESTHKTTNYLPINKYVLYRERRRRRHLDCRRTQSALRCMAQSAVTSIVRVGQRTK